jgi:sugar phosphate isomerase/epimerase
MTKPNRRDLLKSLAAGALGAAVAPLLPAASAKPQRFLAGYAPTTRGTVESYWRVCDGCSKTGFHYLEVDDTRLQIEQAYGNRLSEFRDEMAKRNLTLVGLNIGYPFTDPARLSEIPARNQAICRFLEAVGGLYTGPQGDVPETEPEIRKVARILNVEGRRAWEEYGIRLLYHAHSAFDFPRLMDLTDPRYVHVNPDLGWVHARGGADPVQILRAYRSRLMTVHLKDYDPNKTVTSGGKPLQGSMVPLGQGTLDFPAAIDFLKETDFAGCVMGELVGIGQSFGQADEAPFYPVMYSYMRDKLQLRL